MATEKLKFDSAHSRLKPKIHFSPLREKQIKGKYRKIHKKLYPLKNMIFLTIHFTARQILAFVILHGVFN
jgi:hypothetical protein